MDQPLHTLKAHQLQPGMTIHEITELSFDFAALDEKTLQFLKKHFQGAQAIVGTDAGEKSVSVEELKQFDQLQAITAIPPSLKIAKIVQGLPEQLERTGFLEFRVEVPKEVDIPPDEKKAEAPAIRVASAEAKKRAEQKRVEVKRFMDTVETAAGNREKASTVIEEMMDLGRAGTVATGGVEQMVSEILQQETAPAMQAVAGLRASDQTYAHCVDMSVILQECYEDMLLRRKKEVSDSVKRFTLISGFMHDIGKSEIPKDILESTVRFAPDSKEMMIMRNHTTYGARILSDLGMHKTTINVAHYHHVKKDNTLYTSYPDVPFDRVLPITRLASVVDVYQALIGKRRYKRNWVPGKAVEYIMKLEGSEFDERMVGEFVESMGHYPVGTLVRLSTGELAFVLAIAPSEEPHRPVVAVVENAQGELVSHHSLLDLMVEPDIHVEEVVDHYEHYGESEDQAYRIFQSIHIP